jgi:hypothetical protein
MNPFVAAANWEPGFGDNDLLGWSITFAYFIVALLCAAASRYEALIYRVVKMLQRPALWIVLTVLLVVLGFNKQLDLQILVIHSQFSIKLMSLLGLFLIGTATILAMVLYIGRQWRLYLLAFIGLIYLGVFIVLRASDSLPILGEIYRDYYESIHLLLELGGILMIGISATRAVYRETRQFKSRTALPHSPQPQPAV